MFPIGISGSIRLSEPGNPTPYVMPVRERLVDLLDEISAYDVVAEGDTVRFRLAFFGGAGRYHPLAPVDRGTFQIEIEDTALRVRYRLSTLRFLLAITGLLAVFFGFVFFENATHMSRQTLMIGVGFGWLWLFGMNYLISAIRLPFWLRRKLKDVVHQN